MASACMGDIAILEVALRNRMDRQLSLLALEQNGTEDWYMAGLQFDDRTQYQIREAWNHLTPHPDVYLEVQHPCWSCNSNSSSANASAGVR